MHPSIWLVVLGLATTLVLALFAGGARSASQATPWLNTGPEGGASFGAWDEPVAIHPRKPQVVYASSWNGLFRSNDGGRSWQRRPTPAGYLRDMALHPEDPQTIFAIADRGLYRTTNAGSSWTLLPAPPSAGISSLLAVAVSTSSRNLIYTAGWTHTGPGNRVGVWSSADGGESWMTAGEIDAAADYQPAVLLVDPVQPSTVYVWALGRGIFRSSDGGVNWTSVNVGLPIGRLSSFAAHPTKSGLLFAGTERGEVFRSDDHGQSWTVTASALVGDVVALSVSAADDAVYAGMSVRWADGVESGGGVVYRSADGRAPWRAARSGLTGWYVDALAAHPTKVGTVLAGTEHGIFLSRDGGATWTPRVKGLVATTPTGLAVDPANPRVAFAAVECGVVVSRDSGRTWSGALDTRRERATVGPLLAASGKPSTLYVVKSSTAAPKTRWTLLTSRNAGRSWRELGALPAPVRLLVADASQPPTLYALRGGTQYQGWHRGGIFKSVNGGRSWTPIYSLADKPPAAAFAVDPHQPGVLYAVGARRNEKSHLFRSDNGGRTWRRLAEVGAFSLVADPHTRGTLYALHGGGWFAAEIDVSRDGGRTWAKFDRAPFSTSTLLADPVRPGVLYVGTQDGVWVKLRGSKEWRSKGPTGRDVRWLATDAQARRLYAGIEGGGVAATRLPVSSSLDR